MKLLLAEDEVELSKPLVAILSHSNFEVDPVYDGLEAYEHISAGKYDGIILDIMMPKMDGIEVLKKIRADGVTTPVLMLTAKATADDRVNGLMTGADDYLTKPFDMRELLLRVNKMIENGVRSSASTQPVSNQLSYGNVLLDKSGQLIANKDNTLHLAGGEITLLEIFMKNPDTKLDISRILTSWNEMNSDHEPFDENALSLYISYLTRKLDAIHGNVTIMGDKENGYEILEVKNA